VKDFLKAVVQTISGGVPGLVTGIVDKYVTGMDPQKRASMEAEILAASRKHEVDLIAKATEAQVAFNQRIADMEGTAKDLKGFPVIGPLLIGVRGMLRPAVIIFTILLDYQVFSGAWASAPDGEALYTSRVFWLINLLVFGFIFGERGLQNVLPWLERYRAAKNGGNSS